MKLFANPGLVWDDLHWLRSLTDMPILIKGVLIGTTPPGPWTWV